MPSNISPKPVQRKLFEGGNKTSSGSPNNNSNNNEAPASASEKKTHIEVCARIRPLQISMQSSSSYFGDNNMNSNNKDPTSPQRKPPVPSTRMGIQPPSTGSKSASSKKSSSDAAAAALESNKSKMIAAEELFYAWDVIGNDTAAQSPKTDLVQGRTHQYTLDKVYGPSCTSKEVYNQSVRPLVYAAMEGYHSSVMAYGQTATGKTFSMTGTPSSPGIIPLAIHQCFQSLEKNREYLIRVSYLEIYKEQIRDLLAEGASQIRLFDHREQGLIIKGLREEVVTCPKQIFEILAQGEKRRKIGATNMNQHSSRSHVMVRLWIESRAIGGTSSSSSTVKKMPSNGSVSSAASSSAASASKGTPVRVSSLSLVDLAGSESVKLHGTDEARRQEGHYINKSLMALGKVVYALSEQGKQKDGKINTAPQHIPYRDSKLTRLLQPSLSGNAQMVLICCISPLAMHVEESHNTFKFAARAKKVPQKATIQESVDEKTLLQTYREEIEALKQQLREAKKQQEALLLLQQKKQQQEEEPVTGDEDDMDDEVEELKMAIRNMEHLILKSKAGSSPSVPSAVRSMSEDELMDSVMASDSEDDDDDDDDETALLTLMSETQKSSGATRSPRTSSQSPPRTPRAGVGDEDPSSDMYAELHRIQGLLGSVLKKRHRGGKTTPGPTSITNHKVVPATMNGINNNQNASEVNMLRAQLEVTEVASSLRKADASFLQKQLDEKDALLAEVSKILEQVEQRQVDLEAENMALKRELARLRSAKQSPPSKQSSPITVHNGQVEV